jgi:hypothetical protein
VVDDSDISPSRVNFPLEGPYSPFSEGNSPSCSFQTKRMFHELACVSARVLAHLPPGATVCPLLVSSWSCPVESSSQGAHKAPSPAQASHPRGLPLYWLLGTSFQEKTDLACPITIIPGHGTRLRDKGNLFFSLSERGKLHQARTTDTFWQHALRKTIWMPSERSSFEGIWTNDDDTLAQLDPLMHGRLRWILFTPPFGSHGAVRPRSE